MIYGKEGWTKAEWRAAAKAAREDMRLHADEAATLITFLMNDILGGKTDKIVSLYWPIGHELDTRPLLQALKEKGVQTALPRVAIDGHGLYFHRWSWGEPLESSRFSLSEPYNNMNTLCTPDIVLLPLLAFDEAGHRLGYGAGHYDRTLEGTTRAMKVGLAYMGQKTTILLPAQVHDVPLDAVLTPQGAIWFK